MQAEVCRQQMLARIADQRARCEMVCHPLSHTVQAMTLSHSVQAITLSHSVQAVILSTVQARNLSHCTGNKPVPLSAGSNSVAAVSHMPFANHP